MKFSISIAALFVAGVLASPAPAAPKCYGKNEVYNSCGTACPLTCEEPDPRPCTLQCVAGCFCKNGFIRNSAGACVKPSQC
ncbi:hypothetical protein NM208_g3234 [Fusarium decemcellulare]|uniref:Uncharacterized protein n=1 Tax=Fusarium decemcellulare TaxID=57161 RepID=A0ACC1SPQ4_9HYPO|nr:hypothetical protein NM208_g3234 [Fusarium decemcellulare]